MRRVLELLNATVGYFYVANTQELDEKTQRFVGPASFAYNAILDGLIRQNIRPKFVPTTMEASSGSCDELFNCTGQLRTFQIENWDVSLMAQSHSILRFSGSNSPFLVGPTQLEGSLHILSGVNQSQLIDPPNVQVTDSFKKLGAELFALYAIWVLIAYFLSIIFRKMIFSQSMIKLRLQNDKLFWELISGILNQFRYSPDHNSTRVLWWSFLISMFMFVEYYNGLFSTELTVKVEPCKIDDFKGVVASAAYPFFTNGDSGTASAFEKSQNPLTMAVYARHMANDQSEFERYPEPSTPTLLKYTNLIKNLKAILIGQLPLITMYVFLDCAMKNEENYHHAKDELHLARESYHPVLFSWLFNRNVDYEIRDRISFALRTTIEIGLFDFMYESQFPQKGLESGGVFLKGGGRSQMCLYGDKRVENQPRSMHLGDMVTLFRGFSGAMAIAVALMMFEMFSNFVRTRGRRLRARIFTRTRVVS